MNHMEYAYEFILSDFKVASHEEVTSLSNTVLIKSVLKTSFITVMAKLNFKHPVSSVT